MSASPVPAGPARLVELDALDCCSPIAQADPELATRRFMTLLASVGHGSRRGGSGRATKVFNAYGEAFCLKSLVAADEAAFRGRALAFREEYLAQRVVSGLEGWPAVYGYGSYAGGPVILMDWVEGSTLHAVARYLPRATSADTHPAPEWVASVGIRALQLLALAGRRALGFAHRDLSPRNLMVRLDRAPLREQIAHGVLDLAIIDLGSATATGEEEAGFTQQTHVWRNGTVEYAPPEMLAHDVPGVMRLRHSPKVDVYALCSVLFELYCGSTPYQLTERREVSPYRAKVDFAPVAVSPRAPSEEGLLSCIRAGLARTQEARPDVEGLERMLLAWLEGYAPQMAEALAASPPEELFVLPAHDVRLEMLARRAGGLRGADAMLPDALARRMR